MWNDHIKTAESTLNQIQDVDQEMTQEINELNRKRKFSQISQQETMQSLNYRLAELTRKNDTLSDLCKDSIQNDSPTLKR